VNLWVDVAAMASLFAIGNILFGHFEERTPKWRLPKHGIHPWTAEPKDRYYALRGWKL
jgi:hypothetical protein